MLHNDLISLVGNTPLVELKKIEKALGLKAHLFAKLECFNPAGSVKDRVALSMILDAEEKGFLSKDSTIIEPTSGNTGIGIAAISKMRGYKAIIVMPESMSIERRKIIKSYGASIELTPASLGMKGAISRAKELNERIKGSIILGQFDNPANPKAHYTTTGPEIYRDLDGKVDIFVAGVGTGGTISGVGKFLKEKNSKVEVVAVEPNDSPVLSEGRSGPHKIQGIGAGFVPNTLDTSIYDRVIKVTNDDAFKYAKLVGSEEGVLVGISSGAALYAAILEAKKEENKGKNIVVLFPDGGDRYFSTPLFD